MVKEHSRGLTLFIITALKLLLARDELEECQIWQEYHPFLIPILNSNHKRFSAGVEFVWLFAPIISDIIFVFLRPDEYSFEGTTALMNSFYRMAALIYKTKDVAVIFSQIPLLKENSRVDRLLRESKIRLKTIIPEIKEIIVKLGTRKAIEGGDSNE